MEEPRIIIETDLEPDDAIAILAILKGIAEVKQNISFIVGEGDSRLKLVLLEELLKSIEFEPKSFTIIQGLDSQLPYPTKFLKGEWVEKMAKLPSKTQEEKLQDYITFHQEFRPTHIYFLKPPREALLVYDQIKFENSICYCYGGFNYRAMETPISNINNLASRFKQFHHFSRRVELPPGQDLYDFGATLRRQSPFSQFIRILSLNWNNHYIEMMKLAQSPSETKFVLADILCVYRSDVGKSRRGSLINCDVAVEADIGHVLFTIDDPESRRSSLVHNIDQLLNSIH
jgi:hypothetical protein